MQINEDFDVAADDRRHGEATHLAKAISIRDSEGGSQSSMPFWYSNTKGGAAKITVLAQDTKTMHLFCSTLND